MPSYRSLMHETSALRRVMSQRACRVRYTEHSLEEMRNDEIIDADVRSVLRKGNVTWVETKKDILWHVEGKDSESRKIRVVISVFDDAMVVKIITVMLL